MYDKMLLYFGRRGQAMKPLKTIEEIEEAINEYGEIVISKNTNNNVIIMSMEEYKRKKMKEDIIKKIKQSELEIERGEGIEAELVFKELRELYK